MNLKDKLEAMCYGQAEVRYQQVQRGATCKKDEYNPDYLLLISRSTLGEMIEVLHNIDAAWYGDELEEE
jgi:hypothetical protein